LKPKFRWRHKITKAGLHGASFPGKLLKSLIAIGEFWRISGKKIATYDCIIFLEKQAYVRLLKLLFYLGARISHLEAIETMGF